MSMNQKMKYPRMKKSLFLLLTGCCLLSGWGCSSRNPTDVAAQVAKQNYDNLLKGKYDAFVDAFYRQDEIPDSYREQLVVNMKMFMNQQQREHRGVKETRIVNAKMGESGREANVFLALCYGDSTTEEICVPMVLSDGIWYLR